jgi:hypothetical protein
MTRTSGQVSGPTKDVYLGIRYAGGDVQGLTGIEFGITGLDSLLVTVAPLDSPTAVIGTPAVPSGMDSLYTEGGMNIAWADCLPGDRVLAKLTLRPRTSWPEHVALRVKHRYPPTNSALPFPLLSYCDAPFYSIMSLSGGIYLLGPEEPPECRLSAASTDFGEILDGRSALHTFMVSNQGGGFLTGAVHLDCPDFALVDGPGYSTVPEYSLAGGEQRAFLLRFAPSRPGEQSCWVTSDTGCDSLRFAGRTPPVLPIRVLQESVRDYLGSLVTVEGQPYLPAALRAGVPYEVRYESWLQDESGRGLHLVSGEFLLNAMFSDPGNRLRVRGRLQREGPSLVLRIEYAALSSSGNPPVVPTRVPTSTFDWSPGARDSTLVGTFLEVSGRVTGIEPVGAEVQYWVDDGSGLALVRVRPPDRHGFQLDDRVHAAGALTHLKWASWWWPVLAVRRSEDITMTGRLVLPEARTPLGGTVDVRIRLQANPDPVDAFGLRLVFDGAVLRFLGASCCDLTAAWSGCDAVVAGADTVVVQAAGSTAISAQSDGDALCLSFQVDACGPTLLRLVDLTGDVAEMRAVDGRYACSDCAADGDTNADGGLTPSDALCAFQSFLNGGHVTPECDAAGVCETAASDVNCDGRILPGDALAIFQRWLRAGGPPEACFSPYRAGAGSVSRTGGGGSFRLGAGVATRDGSGNLAVPIERRAIAGGAAFAAVFDFDPGQAEFVELRAADGASRWIGLGARVLAPGRIEVGGFAPSLDGVPPQDSSTAGWERACELMLRPRRGGLAFNRVEWLEGYAGGPVEPVTPDAAPSRLTLGMPRPNPARGRDVFFDIAVPRGLGTPFEIHVLDVRGRLLRRLHSGPLAAGPHAIAWDRRDAHGRQVAAGLYILRVKTAGHVERRKLVVLD